MCPESIRSAKAHDEITVRLSSDRDAAEQHVAEALAAVQEAYNKLHVGNYFLSGGASL